MQEAGRILLMPKGDYSASATHEMLDLVNHNDASWVCKKECTGQEPSDSNTEFWQRFGTAVDLSNYLSKSGGELYGGLSFAHNQSIFFKGADGNDRMGVFANFYDKEMGIYSYPHGKMVLLIPVDGSTPIFDGTAKGNLPLTGGQVKGSFYVWANSESAVRIYGDDSSRSRIKFFGQNEVAFGGLGFYNANKPCFIQTDGTEKDLLHTGNKPTGTYTGNGDATERVIATGGIGSVCVIYDTDSASYLSIVTPAGGIVKTVDGVSSIDRNLIRYQDGNIIVNTNDVAWNGSGRQYRYYDL